MKLAADFSIGACSWAMLLVGVVSAADVARADPAEAAEEQGAEPLNSGVDLVELGMEGESGDSPAPEDATEEPAQPVVAGPLTLNVTVIRQGRFLNMNCELVESSDEPPDSPGLPDRPPQFVVYQNDREIGSGQFEYG